MVCPTLSPDSSCLQLNVLAFNEMQQPSLIPSSHSDDCVSAQCEYDLARDRDEFADVSAKDVISKTPTSPLLKSNSAFALNVLLSMKNDPIGKRQRDTTGDLSGESADGGGARKMSASRRLPPKQRAKALRKQNASPSAPSSCCEMLPPPPMTTTTCARSSPPLSLVERCATFTAALKQRHPPGSPAFAIFVHFVSARHASDPAELKRVILHLIALLKPTPSLLWLFCQLLPRWCFTSAHKAGRLQTDSQ